MLIHFKVHMCHNPEDHNLNLFHSMYLKLSDFEKMVNIITIAVNTMLWGGGLFESLNPLCWTVLRKIYHLA
jgi:hypothetical protein